MLVESKAIYLQKKSKFSENDRFFLFTFIQIIYRQLENGHSRYIFLQKNKSTVLAITARSKAILTYTSMRPVQSLKNSPDKILSFSIPWYSKMEKIHLIIYLLLVHFFVIRLLFQLLHILFASVVNLPYVRRLRVRHLSSLIFHQFY